MKAIVLIISVSICNLGCTAQSHAPAPALVPALNANLPEDIAVIQAKSPGVRIVQTYGGNVGVSYWEVSPPALLKIGEHACSFNLNLSARPQVAAVLAADHGTTIDIVQVDTFGNMTVNAAVRGASRLKSELINTGWQPAANVIQPTPAEVLKLIRTDSGIAFADLQCGSFHAVIGISRDPRHPKVVTYDLTYQMNQAKGTQ